MATTVLIVVNGLSGPRCTVDASTEWTIQQVKEAISEKTEIPVAWQKLLKNTDILPGEVTVSSLISDEHVERLELTLLVEPPRFVEFVGMSNGLEQLEPGHLRKTGGEDWSWDATGVSSESLIVGQGRGLRFRPGTVMGFVIGLGSCSSAPADYTRINYACRCGRDGRFHVIRSGSQIFVGESGAEVDFLVHGDRVEFVVDGVLQYTSWLWGETQLYAVVAFGVVGAEALDIQWL